VVCHKANAWGSTDGNVPNLAGQQERYLERQLIVFRSGARNDTDTQILAAHSTLSNARSVVDVANYLSGLESNPRPVTGSGDHLFVGEDLYANICAACHGDRGAGQSENVVPRIGGQHYPYLRREIEQAADFHKDLAPPEMTSALRSLSSEEKEALADYISRLSPADTGLVQAPGRLLLAAVHRCIHGVVIVLRVALDMRRHTGLFQQRRHRLLQIFDVIPHDTLE